MLSMKDENTGTKPDNQIINGEMTIVATQEKEHW